LALQSGIRSGREFRSFSRDTFRTHPGRREAVQGGHSETCGAQARPPKPRAVPGNCGRRSGAPVLKTEDLVLGSAGLPGSQRLPTRTLGRRGAVGSYVHRRFALWLREPETSGARLRRPRSDAPKRETQGGVR